MELEYILPSDIEKRSFEIIESEIKAKFGDINIPEEIKPIVMRAIHTTADFEYLENLYFSENAVNIALETIKNGAVIITDTNMAKSGINKKALEKHNCECMCFMADEDIIENAKLNNTTRAVASVDKASKLNKPIIYVVGNAPTALIRICEHIENKSFVPEFVIGMPVGFVNVVQSKELLMKSGIPCIISKGRKGGSNVAAAVCNALLYMI